MSKSVLILLSLKSIINSSSAVSTVHYNWLQQWYKVKNKMPHTFYDVTVHTLHMITVLKMQWLTVSVKYPNIFYLQGAGHFFDIVNVSWIECVTCLKIFEWFLNLPFVSQNKTLKEIMMKCKIQAIFFIQHNTPIRKFRPLTSRQCNRRRSTSASSSSSSSSSSSTFIDTSVVEVFFCLCLCTS
jgi:hypothetical protein